MIRLRTRNKRGRPLTLRPRPIGEAVRQLEETMFAVIADRMARKYDRKTQKWVRRINFNQLLRDSKSDLVLAKTRVRQYIMVCRDTWTPALTEWLLALAVRSLMVRRWRKRGWLDVPRIDNDIARAPVDPIAIPTRVLTQDPPAG